MGESQSRKLIAYLPLVFVATFAVVIAPTLFVLWLRESGAVNSMWVALAIGVVVSLAFSQVGAVMWKSRASSDLLFNELMLWGWVQRFRNERRMAAAADLLGLSVGRPKAISGGQLTSEQKKELLTQLSSTLESTDPYTHGHSRRVARHAANIAKQMGLTGAEVAKIRTAGVMHDVGKVETPTSVLHKAGRLSDEEFDIVKLHSAAGADMVSILDDPELTAIVRHHHERLDGTGYPDGLAGDEIPLGARILAVADTFDAITSTRAYRQANPHKKALGILQVEAGTQLDPVAVKAFLECYSGVKPVVFWAVLVNARPRVGASLGQFFSPVTGTNVMATTAAAAAAGAVAVGPGAHTVPASAHPSTAATTEAAPITSPAPFSRSFGPKATTLASVLADRKAKDGGGELSLAGDKAGELRDTTGPKASGGPNSAAGGWTAPGDLAAQNRHGTPAGGGGGGGGGGGANAPAKNKGARNGTPPGQSAKPQPPRGHGQTKGNAIGHSKGNNANGPSKRNNANANANTHGPGNGQAMGNNRNQGDKGNGPGRSGDKAMEKVSSPAAPPPAPQQPVRKK